jgi:glycosyltransferase involved in cell wall biosynthesis
MERKAGAYPLLSIVIPTRNRTRYAISAIQSILGIVDSRLELVVQDNSDVRELEVYVRDHITDCRFRYRYTPPPLSLIDNVNAAVDLATGEYVCLIGDDDGVNPEILAAASWAKIEGIDCIAAKQTASYLWQGTGIRSTLFTRVRGGSLSVSGFDGYIKCGIPERELRELVRSGGAYYLACDLPKLYHGLVHRRCLSAVRDKTGAYLGGLSPDIFASVALACVASRVIVTDYPLTIPGACGASGSVLEGAIRRHSKRLEDAPHLRDRGDYRWCELVPRVYTAETIWADSAIAALRAMGREDLVRQLCVWKLSALCIGANRGVMWPVLRTVFARMRPMGCKSVVGFARFAWSLITCPGARLGRRAWNRFLLSIRLRRIHRISGLTNMVDASAALTGYLAERGHTFEEYASSRTCTEGRSHTGSAFCRIARF